MQAKSADWDSSGSKRCCRVKKSCSSSVKSAEVKHNFVQSYQAIKGKAFSASSKVIPAWLDFSFLPSKITSCAYLPYVRTLIPQIPLLQTTAV